VEVRERDREKEVITESNTKIYDILIDEILFFSLLFVSTRKLKKKQNNNEK
jgi:hypothetical protein